MLVHVAFLLPLLCGFPAVAVQIVYLPRGIADREGSYQGTAKAVGFTGPWMSRDVRPPKVYVYELPRVLDGKLLRDHSSCEQIEAGTEKEQACLFGSLVNISTADGSSFEVRQPDQFALGRIFLAALRRHARRTFRADEADLFFIPSFYEVKVAESHCPSATSLLQQLEHLNNDTARRHFWISSRTGWSRDMCDVFNLQPKDDSLVDQLFAGTTKLALEDRSSAPADVKTFLAKELSRHSPPSAVNLHSVPYPSLSSGLSARQAKKLQDIEAGQVRRKFLAMGAWGVHGGLTSRRTRKLLSAQCKQASSCFFLDLEDPGYGYTEVFSAMLESTFCLQPVGDTVSRKSMVDALLLGCVPVLFAPLQQALWPWHVGRWEDVSVILDPFSADVIGQLAAVSTKDISSLRRNIRRLFESLTYPIPGSLSSTNALELSLQNIWSAAQDSAAADSVG